MNRRIVATALFAVALAFVLGRATAQDDPNAEMDEWNKLGTPGKEQAELCKCAGTWDAAMKHWPAPGAEPLEMACTSTIKAIFDGRYVIEEFQGSSPMGPYSGMGLLGYDNARKEYFSTWIDSMSTGMMLLRGTADASGKVITLSGDLLGPFGKTVKMRTVSTVANDGSRKFEMFETKGDAPEHKAMELTYTRKK